MACEHNFSLFFTGEFPLEMYIQQAIQNGDIALVAEVLLHLVRCFQICTLWNAPFVLRKLMILIYHTYYTAMCTSRLSCIHFYDADYMSSL